MKALIVDGYNAIHKIPALSGKMERSLREARSALTRLAGEYCRRKLGGTDKYYVVFDGREEYDSPLHPSPPHQVFAHRQKADHKIIDLLRKLSPRYRITVVSDDNFVNNNARALKAGVIGIAAFSAALKKKPPARKAGDSKKISPEAAEEINQELKKHWNL